MRASWSVQSIVRRFPARSATISSSPIGVCRRSTTKARGSTMGSHPEMLSGIGMPGPPRARRMVVDGGNERVALPIARRAQAGSLGDQGRELGIAREVAADGGDVGGQIEYAAHAGANGGEAVS